MGGRAPPASSLAFTRDVDTMEDVKVINLKGVDTSMAVAKAQMASSDVISLRVYNWEEKRGTRRFRSLFSLPARPGRT